MAEAVFAAACAADARVWHVDSAALLRWNIGQPPEHRCLNVLADHGLQTQHLGRMVGIRD